MIGEWVIREVMMPRSKRLSGCNTRCLVATTTQHSETLVALSRRREGKGDRGEGVQSRWVMCSDELFTTRRVSTLRSRGAQVVSSGAVRGRGRVKAEAEAKQRAKQSERTRRPAKTKTFQRVASNGKAKI